MSAESVRGASRAGAYWPNAEQELILRAALGAGAEANRAWRALAPRLDVARADRSSGELLALLGWGLRRRGIDDERLAALAEIQRATAARNRALFARGRGLVAALADAGVDSLVLKGAALAPKLYPEPGLRPMGDLDVLVPTARAQQAIDAARRAGWSPRYPITPDVIGMQHAADLLADGGAVRCDLHWHAYWECCQPGSDDDLWARSVPLELDGAPTRALDPTDQLLHLCVNGSRRARRPKLLWVPDALLVLGAGGIDWARLCAEAERRRFVLRAETMLEYLRATFGAAVPDHVVERLAALPVSSLERREYHVANRPQGLLGELPSYWCNYRRLRGGARFPAPLGFLRYLQQTWKAESLGRAARGALARAGKRMRSALGSARSRLPRRG